MITGWFRRWVRELHRMGATLDERSLKFVRGARWWAGPAGALFLYIAWTDDRWFTILFFGGVGLIGLFPGWPGAFIMVRGHAMRDRIDTRGALTFDAVRLSSAVAFGVGISPLVWGMVDRYWP